MIKKLTFPYTGWTCEIFYCVGLCRDIELQGTLSFKLYHEYPINNFRFLQVWNGVLCQKEVTLCVGVHQGVVMSPCGISGFSVVHYSGIIYLDKIITLYDSLLYNYKFVNRNIYISFIVFKINSFLVKPIKLFFYSISSTL